MDLISVFSQKFRSVPDVDGDQRTCSQEIGSPGAQRLIVIKQIWQDLEYSTEKSDFEEMRIP